MKLTLIRHGITHGNKYGLYYGATDLPLLEEGIAELRERRLPVQRMATCTARLPLTEKLAPLFFPSTLIIYLLLDKTLPFSSIKVSGPV